MSLADKPTVKQSRDTEKHTSDTKMKEELLQLIKDKSGVDLNSHVFQATLEDGSKEYVLTIEGMVEAVKGFKLSKKEERRMISKIRFNKAFQEEMGFFDGKLDKKPEESPKKGEEKKHRKICRKLLQICGETSAAIAVSNCTNGKPFVEQTSHVEMIDGEAFIDVEGMNKMMHNIDVPRWRLKIWEEEYAALRKRIEIYKSAKLERFLRRREALLSMEEKTTNASVKPVIDFLDTAIKKIQAI